MSLTSQVWGLLRTPRLWAADDISSCTDWDDFRQLAFGWKVSRNVLEERCRAFQMLATGRMRVEHHNRLPILVTNGINGTHLIGIARHEHKTVRPVICGIHDGSHGKIHI